MKLNNFHSLFGLTTEKSEGSIYVRAQAIWKGINRATNEFRGYNITFIDDQNCRIHAFINEKIYKEFEKDLEEGKLYSVSNFQVNHYQGDETNRAVRNENHIYFHSETKLKKLYDGDAKIEQYAFDLFALEDVDKFLTDNRFLIDVIGVVDNIPKLLFSKEDDKKSHVKFKITDGRYKVNVTFFNEFGQSFLKAFNEIAEEGVVVIIASAKVTKYDGELYLSNFPATRFYLNPNHYSIPNFLNSLTVVEIEDENDTKIYTVEQIKQLKEDYIEKMVLCEITVKKVEQQYNWYDNFCTTCDEEVNKVDGRYPCLKCKRNVPYPDKRFRLCTVCNDKTGIIAIVFPDDEIQRLTGKNVFEVENDDDQVSEEIPFPPLLKNFENKQFIVTLIPTKENIKKSCNIYQAKKLNQPQERGDNHNPSEISSPEIVQTTINTETESAELPRTHSPPTEKSTNRSKGRKNKGTVKCEMDDNTPIAKMMKT